MTEIDDRTRRTRAHQFAGAAALVLAIGAFPVLGWIAALGMLLIGLGNLLAARGVKNDGAVPTPAKAMMILGAVVFLAVIVTLVVTAGRS